MATNASITDLSYLAGADLSASQFYLVKIGAADRTVILAAATTDLVEGVLGNKPTTGQAAEVQTAGRAKCVYGATVVRGAPLMSDASGRAITQTGTNPTFAIAEESGAVGEIHSVRML